MKIGDRVFVHGYVDEIRKDTIIIRNNGGYFGTVPSEIITGELSPAQPDAIRPRFVAEDRYLKNHYQIFPHCPKCNYELETGDCYCRVCGCHIDWSEDDEE